MLIAIGVVAWACILVGLWYAHQHARGRVHTTVPGEFGALALPSRLPHYWPVPPSRFAPLRAVTRNDPVWGGATRDGAIAADHESVPATIGDAGSERASGRSIRSDLNLQVVSPVQGIQAVEVGGDRKAR